MAKLCLFLEFSDRPFSFYNTRDGTVGGALGYDEVSSLYPEVLDLRPHSPARGLVENVRSEFPLAVFLSPKGILTVQKGGVSIPVEDVEECRHWRTFMGAQTWWGNESHLVVDGGHSRLTESRRLELGRYRFRDLSVHALHDFLGIVATIVRPGEGRDRTLESWGNGLYLD